MINIYYHRFIAISLHKKYNYLAFIIISVFYFDRIYIFNLYN